MCKILEKIEIRKTCIRDFEIANETCIFMNYVSVDEWSGIFFSLDYGNEWVTEKSWQRFGDRNATKRGSCTASKSSWVFRSRSETLQRSRILPWLKACTDKGSYIFSAIQFNFSHPYENKI